VFGVFVDVGVLLAWIWSITFIPAFVMLIPERWLAGFGQKPSHAGESTGLLGRWLVIGGGLTQRYSRGILAATALLVIVAVYGITQININDNPTKWFTKSHPIRVADRVLNAHFGGTYMAFLALEPAEHEQQATSNEQRVEEVFKQPEVLRYLSGLQAHLNEMRVDGQRLVGKSNSVADIVKTVHRELLEGEESQFRIPDSPEAVAQTLMTYESSHRPHDLWHFITPDYRRSSTWIQLRSGDNQDMSRVVDEVDAYMTANPPPMDLRAQWFGLTYINVEWQQKMVAGMLESFLGSFLVVLLMMTLLFRSALWGLLSMIPLTITIALIYGLIGLMGKDYDMPVAVLSSLSLGLAVDFAIHFLARTRQVYERHCNWAESVKGVFGEPARAITRNALVVGVGFLPLLAAPLMPYKTVGFFIAAILSLAGVATLVLLPALVRVLEPWLFPSAERPRLACACVTCIVAGFAGVGVVALNVHQFLALGWSGVSVFSAIALVACAGLCLASSRRASCRVPAEVIAVERKEMSHA
jgi:uncharacterized protein